MMDHDRVKQIIDMIRELTYTERLVILHQLHDELREPDHLEGGGMNSGSMVLPKPAPERDALPAHTPPAPVRFEPSRFLP